MPAAFL